jgi:hypothetical protein
MHIHDVAGDEKLKNRQNWAVIMSGGLSAVIIGAFLMLGSLVSHEGKTTIVNPPQTVIINNNVTTQQDNGSDPSSPSYHTQVTYIEEPSPFNATPAHTIHFCMTDTVPCSMDTWTGSELPYIFITYENPSAYNYTKAFHVMDLRLTQGTGTAACGTTLHYENFIYQLGSPQNGGHPTFEGSAVGSNNCGLHGYINSDWQVQLSMELDGVKKPDNSTYGPGNKITIYQDPWDYQEQFAYHGGFP